jgi:hypothetical protein
MTVADVIADDHRAGREIFAIAGNMPQQGDAGRLAEMERFHALWDAHNAMMEEVVYPVLEGARADLAQEGRARQREAGDLLADLAARAGASAGVEGDWLAGFERFKDLFDHQVALEEAQVITAILRELPPQDVAHLTEGARELRARRGI